MFINGWNFKKDIAKIQKLFYKPMFQYKTITLKYTLKQAKVTDFRKNLTSKK